jgi:hypothetical protein
VLHCNAAKGRPSHLPGCHVQMPARAVGGGTLVSGVLTPVRNGEATSSSVSSPARLLRVSTIERALGRLEGVRSRQELIRSATSLGHSSGTLQHSAGKDLQRGIGSHNEELGVRRALGHLEA